MIVLETPLTRGRFQGHARWHLLSPWFYRWRLQRPPANERVSDHWRSAPTVWKDADALEAKYRASATTGPRTYEVVASMLTGFPSAHVIDAGCGDGQWLRYLAERGWPTDHLWGGELDPKRVDNARRQLARWPRVTVFPIDLMDGTGWPQIPGPRVVTMLGVSPTFNDIEYRRVVERLVAALRPDAVIDVSLQGHIFENYGGRHVENFFRDWGYLPIINWIPDRLAAPWRRRAYWPAVRCVTLVRHEAAMAIHAAV